MERVSGRASPRSGTKTGMEAAMKTTIRTGKDLHFVNTAAERGCAFIMDARL
jgi:hypothetical protein